MERLLISNDTAVITMLLLFIAGVLTKRIVPWWVHEAVLEKLKKYEEAAPDLISEMNRMMTLIKAQQKPRPRKVRTVRRRRKKINVE